MHFDSNDIIHKSNNVVILQFDKSNLTAVTNILKNYTLQEVFVRNERWRFMTVEIVKIYFFSRIWQLSHIF